MILRVYALYGRRRPILVLLMVLWTLQIVLSSISMMLGFRTRLFLPHDVVNSGLYQV
ncbi:hypothetical protein BDZ94DRAFT_1254508, partial [Collybia nuda]